DAGMLRLTLDEGAQVEDMIAELPCRAPGRLQRASIGAQNAVVDLPGKRLGCLGNLTAHTALQVRADRRRSSVQELILLQDVQGSLEGGWIRCGRSRGNDVERIADHVGDNEAEQGAAPLRPSLAEKCLRQPPALDA